MIHTKTLRLRTLASLLAVAVMLSASPPAYTEPTEEEEKGTAAEEVASPAAEARPTEPQKAATTSDETAKSNDEKAASEDTITAKDEKPDKLTIASWGGAYSESQRRAYFTPFQSETGISIDVVSHNGKFDSLNPDDANKLKWDIIDVDSGALEQACRDGHLEKVDASALIKASDGTSVGDDFFPDTLHECGVPSVAWSSAIVFDKRAFKKKNLPKTAKDFFDVKRFPGKRALPNGPKYTLELALMADGVAPDEVYQTLATEAGVKRALNRLDAIRDHIVWWEQAHQPLKLLDRQGVTMAVAFNGRIFSAIVAESKPFGIVWDGQVFDVDLWAIPKGSPHLKSALEFIAFATKPTQLARQAGWFPYGPMRRSAVELVGKHPEVDVDMSAYIPTSKQNFKRALRLNASWWREHEDELKKRLQVWTTGDGGSADTGSDAESENAG